MKTDFEDNKEMMGVTFNGSVTFNGPMFDIHDNENVTIVNDRQQQEMEAKPLEIHNHFEAGSNCQVFNGAVNGSVFAMPGSNVTQVAGKPNEEKEVKDGEESKTNKDEEMTFFIHPGLAEEEGWRTHNEIKRLASRQGIQEICRYLSKLKDDKKVLLPQNAERAYNELVRLGMPNGGGYSLKTFTKYYKR